MKNSWLSKFIISVFWRNAVLAIYKVTSEYDSRAPVCLYSKAIGLAEIWFQKIQIFFCIFVYQVKSKVLFIIQYAQYIIVFVYCCIVQYSIVSVSYTHLDVYKRQVYSRAKGCCFPFQPESSWTWHSARLHTSSCLLYTSTEGK